MIKTEQNISLRPYNTFGIEARAAELIELHSPQELQELIASGIVAKKKHYIVGGGSNIVPAGDYDGLIVALRSKGIAKLREEGDTVWVEAQAGEVWDDFVHHCLRQGWHGIENLVAIPGTVGAAPVQNVGAYGMEAKDVVDEVRAYDITTGRQRLFTNGECHFGYRSSIFKQELAGRYIVASVVFRLSHTFHPNLHYKAVTAALADREIDNPTAVQLADAISEVRWSKLPRPEETGSAGSFFKNPIVTDEVYRALLAREPQIVAYPADGGYKLSAGWLIEQAGWKGKALGHAAVYDKQALVIVNRGGCTGDEVLQIADAIVHDVAARFGVSLEKEAIILH